VFDSTVTISTWFFILLLLAAGYAVIMSALIPSVRWFFRRRLNKAVDKLNTSLQIKVRPFQRTKRQVLIDQLMFDQDILASTDGLVSKPGYGTAVEAVVNQLPFVFTSRGNFPDEAVIIDWLQRKGRCQHISQHAWSAGEFGNHLQQLSEQPKKPEVVADGATVAAEIIRDYL